MPDSTPSVSPIAEAPEATPSERNPKEVRAGFYRVGDALAANDRAAMRAIVDEASDKLSALCNGQRWTMSVPVQDTDTDMVLGRAISLARKLVERTGKPELQAPASLAQRSDDRPTALSEEEREFVREMTDEAAATPSQWAPDISSHDLGRLLAIISRLTSGGSEPAGTLNSELKVRDPLGLNDEPGFWRENLDAHPTRRMFHISRESLESLLAATVKPGLKGWRNPR